ncbi:MAG: hypothetical protein J7J98_10145 [candidate division Zixibacteria bacterium]|nr:hypothetical protein [candidate division Zixibacteria bacterium]
MFDRLRVTVGDTTGTAGEENSAVSVFLTNPSDDIFAFTIHIALDRNDIANFQTQLDTIEVFTYWACNNWVGEVCTDSVGVDDPLTEPWDFEHIDTVEAYAGVFDTVGTLISGWDYVQSRAVSTGDLGLDILLTAISDTDSIPGYVPPLSPQGGGVLFRVLADIFPIPPEQEDRTATVRIDVGFKRWFGFSTPEGESIGWITVQVPDTNYYMCTSPEPPPGTGCYEWTKVYSWECPAEGCDSVGIQMVDIPVLDSTQVSLFDGSITVLNTCCIGRVGDTNNSGEDEPTIGDVSTIIDVLFINNNWDIIDCLAETDINQSGGVSPTPNDITIGDVSILIDYLFITGSSLGLPDCL